MDSKPTFSFHRKPLTVFSTKTFFPARDEKKAKNDEENIGQNDVANSMAPKSFYPVRIEPKRRPALMPVTPRAFYQVKTVKKKKVLSTKSPKLGHRFGAAPKKKSVKPKVAKPPKQPKTKSPKASKKTSLGKVQKKGKFYETDESSEDGDLNLTTTDTETSTEDQDSEQDEKKCNQESEVELVEDDTDMTYEMIRQRNIEDRLKLFKQLKIGEAKSKISSDRRTEQAAAKTAKRSRPTSPKEQQEPARKSMRLRNTMPEKSTQLPLMDPPMISPASTTDERCRPPLTDLQIDDVASSIHPGKDLDRIVKEKIQFLKLFCPSLVSSSSKGSISKKRVVQTEEEVESYVRKLKIKKDGVIKVTPSRIFSMAVHPSEDRCIVAVGDKVGAVAVWSSDYNKSAVDKNVQVFYPHSSPVNCLTFDKYDSGKLVSTSYDGTIRSFDLVAQKLNLIYGTDLSDATYTGYHAQLDANTFLVTLGSTGMIGLVDTRESNLSRSRDFEVFEKGNAKTVSVHPLKKHLVLCPNNRGACGIFDIRTRTKILETVTSLMGHTKGISSAFFSPETGNSIVTCCYDSKIRIYDVTSADKIFPRKQINHDNQTGRWLTTFKAEWHPSREDVFFVGSMNQSRQVDVFDNETGELYPLRGEHLNSICSVVKAHPTLDVVVAGNASGRVFAFK